MSAVRPKHGPPKTTQARDHDQPERSKVRCLCGKWWAFRSGETLILRCKLCRRDIVITGESIRVEYR